ncbi:hypothetical protein D9757_002349 [Collybiopsis confluens]|uniref:Uncharacterized protein n=1 Tax=Collybiopsis confluens TaxID=2823264 RepID=A0A8H5HXV3_9AGAR|nr:hypothetical protein D9757_002349 [Collybiopsis confluens]
MASTERLHNEREKFRQRIADLVSEDDPLAVYIEFVQWTIHNFSDDDPNSELIQLLDEATKKFRQDESYKHDLRYLKLWTLYANRVSQRSAIGIYSQLWKNGYGLTYSLLYEEYATALEAAGRTEDADQIYRIGIQRQARPVERLKAQYTDFRGRRPKMPSKSRETPLSSPTASSSPKQPSTAASRYATMLAPPPPERRPEMLRFDMSLLYTEKTGEFCIEEARARSMGLYRKEWPVLPVRSLAPSVGTSSLSVPLKGSESSTGRFTKRKSMMGEPTVTINTREALEDVFGMYNSPDRTIRMGSKHAPVRKIEPVAMPQLTPSSLPVFQNGTSNPAAFRPLVDENQGARRKENKPAFAPFVDSEITKPPSSSSQSRPVFASKDVTTPPSDLAAQNEKPLKESKKAGKPLTESIFFQKVFIPETKAPLAPLREAHTDDHGHARPKAVLTHERAKSDHDAKPFMDSERKSPLRVFHRPSEVQSLFALKQSAQNPSPSSTSAPPVLTFTPYKDPTADRERFVEEPSKQDHEELDSSSQLQGPFGSDRYPDEDENDYSDDFIDEPLQEDYDEPLQAAQEEVFDGQEVDYRDVPFGGRFGKFNVMTPITERTFEYTSTSHSTFNTPSNLLRSIPPLDEEDEQELEAAQLVPDGADDLDEEEGYMDEKTPRAPPPVTEEASLAQSSKLSLVDILTLSSNFRPPNPCNPFDPLIMRTLLSRFNSDPQCYSLTDTDYNSLDGLQKFTKKIRKSSGGSSDNDGVYPLTLHGQKFMVSEKLGEGGFGAVFKARDLGAQPDEDFYSEDDQEDEGTSMVALKVVKPRNFWEYHVLRLLHSALPPAHRRSIVFPHALYAFRDESYLVLDYCPQGTLLDIVNAAESAGVSQQGACLDELLVMFFAVELLRLLETMHTIGFIHGDLKIDNCLLRLEDVPGGSSAWSSKYQPSGEGGWSHKGLKIIDFGRTIDTRLFPADQKFIAEWATDERDCIEIQQGKPWTFQTDYFGLAGIVYCMFFGKYIQANSISSSASADGRTKLKLATPLKRYWQTDLWNSLFDLLLNPMSVKPDGHMPLTEELRSIRADMENWIQANCNRTSGTLKGLLKKVEMSCLR